MNVGQLFLLLIFIPALIVTILSRIFIRFGPRRQARGFPIIPATPKDEDGRGGVKH